MSIPKIDANFCLFFNFSLTLDAYQKKYTKMFLGQISQKKKLNPHAMYMKIININIDNLVAFLPLNFIFELRFCLQNYSKLIFCV